MNTFTSFSFCISALSNLYKLILMTHARLLTKVSIDWFSNHNEESFIIFIIQLLNVQPSDRSDLDNSKVVYEVS